jgi:hypothetical protein
VLADEFQDVNLAQCTWLRLLAAQHDEIFVVGDDDQSVYGWRGADVGYIRRFTRDFPKAAVFRLEENFRSTGHILGAANTVIAQDPSRLGKTRFTRKPSGYPVEIIRFRNAEAEASGIISEITRRRAEGLAWNDMAVLYRSNALSRSFEEALMHARVPYTLIGDVGFYQRAEIKDALALLRLAATPDDAQADEAFRRVINVPARGFGAKAMDIDEVEAAWRRVPLLLALETAPLPPKTRAAGLTFADAIRHVGRNRDATLADQLSLLLDPTGYRGMLRESRADDRRAAREPAGARATRWRLPHGARASRSCRPLHRRSGRRGDRPRAVDDPAQGQRSGVPARLPAGLGSGCVPAGLRRPGRGAAARLCRHHARHAPCHNPPRARHLVIVPRRHSPPAPDSRLATPAGRRASASVQTGRQTQRRRLLQRF